MYVNEADMILRLMCAQGITVMKHFCLSGRPWGISLEACCPCLAEACECDAGPFCADAGGGRPLPLPRGSLRAVREYLDIRSRQDDERIWEEEMRWRNARLYAEAFRSVGRKLAAKSFRPGGAKSRFFSYRKAGIGRPFLKDDKAERQAHQ